MELDSRPAVKVTVLMTLYNKGPFVEEAVLGILASTFKDFELLVVDDASTDGGPSVVRGITDPRIRLLESARNMGRAAAANRGYDAARGDYVAVLDADDIAHPERLAKQVAFMDAHPDVGACGSWLQAFGANTTLLRFPATDREARAMMLFGAPVSYGACIFRRSVLETHHLRCDPDWRHPGMDYLFMLRVGFHTAYANLPEPLVSYRKGAQNMRHGRDATKDARMLCRAVFDLFGIAATDTQVDLQLFLHELERDPPTARQVRALCRWKNDLLNENRQRGLFPEPEFAAWVEQRWDRLFHTLVRCDAAAAFAHMRCAGRVKERAGYLLGFSLRRWLGRPLDRASARSQPALPKFTAPLVLTDPAMFDPRTMEPIPRIAIVVPSADQYSETFIAEHVGRLQGVVRVFVAGNLPRRLSTGEQLMRTSMAGRGLDLLLAGLVGKDLQWLLQRRIAGQLRRDGIQVVLAEYGNTGQAMIESCRQAKVPMAVHFFGFDAHRTDLIQEMGGYRRLFDQAAALVVVSRHMEQHLLSLGAPAAKLHYNSCGIDLDKFAAGDPAQAAPHFVGVGRFVNKKAPHLTLAAFRLALEKHPAARLTLVGDGPLWESCGQLVKALGLQHQVDLPGVLKPAVIATLQRGARAFVQHSVRAANGDSEGTPVAVLEAMASGLPVIATRHAGIMDVVAHEERGLLCDEFDVRTMADHIVRLIDDPALASRMGRAGRAYVEKDHRVQDRIATLQDILTGAVLRS